MKIHHLLKICTLIIATTVIAPNSIAEKKADKPRLGFAGLLSKSNREKLPTLKLESGKSLSDAPIELRSGAANSALEGWSHYCSTKAASKKLTECAHKEMFDKGIRVIGLSPGTVATDMMAQIKESGVNPVSQLDWSTHIPPEWVAIAVAYLCTPESDQFLGTDFSIKTEEGRQRVGLI
jgi:NAD(P)-dependent dehydrogenase (short-subunit alcohol dehydrogenase family)